MYDELLQYGLERCEQDGCSVRMCGMRAPVSITEDEFKFISEYVALRGYVSGYEVATGFGVSACAIGLGLAKNGGSLVSIDAYIEEHYLDGMAYRGAEPVVREGVGLKVAERLRSHFGLEGVIDLRLGWSPDDVSAVLGDRRIDFAFIDGGHFDECLVDDLLAVKDRLTPRCTVMLHDTQHFAKKTLKWIEEWMGCELYRPPLYHHHWLGYYERD